MLMMVMMMMITNKLFLSENVTHVGTFGVRKDSADSIAYMHRELASPRIGLQRR